MKQKIQLLNCTVEKMRKEAAVAQEELRKLREENNPQDVRVPSEEVQLLVKTWRQTQEEASSKTNKSASQEEGAHHQKTLSSGSCVQEGSYMLLRRALWLRGLIWTLCFWLSRIL
jgi:hypothetical protein